MLSDTQSIKRLVGHIGVYSLGNALQRLGAFVLLPIYIAHLSPEEYGLLSLVSILPAVLSPLLTLGLPSAITRYYHVWNQEGSIPPNLAAIWGIATLFSLGATVVLDHVGEELMTLFVRQAPFEPYLRLGLWWSFVMSLSSCPLLLLRIQEKSTSFILTSLLSFFGGSMLIIWAVLSGRGVEGVLWMQIVSNGGISFILTLWFVSQVNLRLHDASLRRSASFALPLVPSAFLEMMSSRTDRFFLDKWTSLSEIGTYSVANQLAQVMKFFYDSVKPAWIPFYMRAIAERVDSKDFLGKASLFYIACLGVVGTGVLILVPEIMHQFFTSGAYADSISLLPILVAAYFFQGLLMIGSLGIQAGERTHWQPIIQAVHLAILIGLHVMLTRQYGAVGAATAMILSSVLLSVVYFIASQKAFPTSLSPVKVFGLCISVLLVGGLVHGVPSLPLPVKGLIFVGHLLFTIGFVVTTLKIQTIH